MSASDSSIQSEFSMTFLIQPQFDTKPAPLKLATRSIHSTVHWKGKCEMLYGISEMNIGTVMTTVSQVVYR